MPLIVPGTGVPGGRSFNEPQPTQAAMQTAMGIMQQQGSFPQPVAEDKNGYPSVEAAQFAERQGLAYGKGYEPEVMNRRMTVTSTPVFSLAKDWDDLSERIEKDPGRKLDLNTPEGVKALTQTKDEAARAMLAASRSGIATLGFDPREVHHDMTSPAESLGMSGFTVQRGEGGREVPNVPSAVSRKTIASYGEGVKATVLHESIHRGFELLRRAMKNDPEFWKASDQLTKTHNDLVQWGNRKGVYVDKMEEHLTRYLMRHTMGDPEKTSVPGDLRQHSEMFMADPKNQAALAVWDRKAAELVAKRHGGRGPQ